MRRVPFVLALATSASLSLGALAALPAEASVSASFKAPPSEPIAGQYIVVLKDSVSASSVDDLARSLAPKGSVIVTYKTALKGFSARMTEKEAQELASDPKVSLVQQDGKVHASTTQIIPAPPNTYWGLNRIDQRARPGNLAGRYIFSARGTGVRAYVLDTGIQTTHTQFGGRAVSVFTATGLPFPGVDCFGHGTHVAGIIGGSTFGVAKNVLPRSVKVLGCDGSGSFTQVIQGVDFVTANAFRPAIANMSLGGSSFLPLDIAVNNSVESGITYSLAAGNSNADACSTSPAGTLSAITVGATGNRFAPTAPISDTRADYSNFGPCLDIFAPGSLIKSACSNTFNGSMGCTGSTNNKVTTISGTSMAAPHVAGVTALILQLHPTWNPLQIRNYLVNTRATRNIVGSPGTGSLNRLLFSGL